MHAALISADAPQDELDLRRELTECHCVVCQTIKSDAKASVSVHKP
jgi:hypothetical protein